MKAKTILIPIIILILASTAHAQSLQGCEIRPVGTCTADETNIGVVTSQGHFNQTGTQGMAPYRLCCPSAWNIGYGDATFSYAPSGGHVGNPGVYGVDVFLGNAGSIQSSCDVDEACVFRVSNQGHVASCDTPNHPMQNNFPNRLCLSLMEICDDGVDNTGDGLIDCASPACHPSSENSFVPQPCAPGDNFQTTDFCVYFNETSGEWENDPDCIGPDPVTGEDTTYYCSYGASDDPDVHPQGFCCPAGRYAIYDEDEERWECEVFSQCGVGSAWDCGYDFDDNWSQWFSSVYVDDPENWCHSQVPNLYSPSISPERSTACCLIPKFGNIGYYVDAQNVRIWG